MIEAPVGQPENATAAYRTATLAARQAALWIADAHVFVGLVQVVTVLYGIRLMTRANDVRERQLDLAEKRHAEAMAAPTVLIERTAGAGAATIRAGIARS